MPTVLLASDERDDIPNWVEGYRACGWEVVTGTHNFKLRSAKFDLVHHQWPEELSNWRVPDAVRLAEIKTLMAWWRARTPSIFTVNNLYPHGFHGNVQYRELYSEFFRNCRLTTHFTEVSRRLVCEEFPAAREAHHLVHTPFNYERLLPLQKKRRSCRAELDIQESDFVIFVFGTLRSWAEIDLIRQGFDEAMVPNKRLLMAGKLNPGNDSLSRWQRKWRMLKWETWLRQRKAVTHSQYIPEEELYRFFDSCDAVLVPRIKSLNSALPAIGMTFGCPIIAPDHGSYPEILFGSENPIYRSGEATSLARSIERAAGLDRNLVGLSNAKTAARWPWQQLVQSCLSELKPVRPRPTAPQLKVP